MILGFIEDNPDVTQKNTFRENRKINTDHSKDYKQIKKEKYFASCQWEMPWQMDDNQGERTKTMIVGV